MRNAKDLLFTNQLNTWNSRNMFPFPLKAFSPINHIWNYSFSTRSSFRPLRSFVHSFIHWANKTDWINIYSDIIISRTDNGIVCVLLIGFRLATVLATEYWGLKMFNISNDDAITFRIECTKIFTHRISHTAHRTSNIEQRFSR